MNKQEMNQYIIPLPHNDPRLLSHVSHAFSLVDLGKRLLEAAKNGDVEEVKNLMSSGAPFTTDWLGISPLHFAAMNGHLTSCEALLRAGISRDARTKVDRTPLHLAAQEGHADIVELLLRSGADLGAKDMLRMTALHWAAERGHVPVVQMLMRFGADAHVKNKFELTPLNIAQGKGHVDACDAMLNSQHDLASSVDSMNAINGELQTTNAYILTDEKTLVPAAPPAGEVIVTATTVEEQTDGDEEKIQELEAAAAAALVEELHPRLANGLVGEHGEPQHVSSNHVNSNVRTCLDHSLVNHVPRPDSVGQSDEQNGDEQAPERDIMLVETPEGDLLYVRQHRFSSSFLDTADNPLSLAIYTSSGERINDPPLLAKVTEVMSRNMVNHSGGNQPCVDGMPGQHNTVDINRMLDSQTSVHESISPTPNPPHCVTTGSETVLSEVQLPSTITTALRSQRTSGTAARKRLRCGSSIGQVGGNDAVVKSEVSPTTADRLPAEEPGLLDRLAAFASQPDACGGTASLHVEGVGLNASSEDVYLWCMCQGLYPRGYTCKSDFMIEFIYQDEAFILSAGYDTDLGVVTVKHPK